MIGKFLLRGLLAGLIAGVIAFGFAFVFGEPSVDGAIAFEEQMAPADEAHSEEEGAASISRDTQKSIGLLTGITVLGVTLGGIYAVVFSFANGRLGQLDSRQTALVVAALCFVTVFLTPWLKYPASPPASTFDDTIAFRTTLYFLMLVLSIALTVATLLVRSELARRLGQWNATVYAAVGYVAVVLVLTALMPTVNEVPEGFPASVLWEFRVASLGIQAVLWAGIGTIFALLVDRPIRQRSPTRLATAG